MFAIKPRKPEINWANPITEKLVLDLPFFEFSGNPEDIINNRNATMTASTWIKDLFGPCIKFSQATSSINTGFSQKSDQRTYETYIYQISDGGGGLGRIFEPRTGATQIELWYTENNNPGTGGRESWTYERDFTTGATRGSVLRPPLRTWHHAALSYDSSNTTNMFNTYIDGAKVSTWNSTQNGTGTAKTNTDNYILGNRTNDNTRNFDGYMLYFRIYNRILTDEEIKELYTNPFRIYKGIKKLKTL